MTFDLTQQRYDEGRIRQFKQQLLQRVRALPAIEAAGLTDFVPLSLNLNNESIQIEGQPEAQGAEAPIAMTGVASPGTLAALGTRLAQGRDFTEQDSESQQRVALVNETFARRFWPEQSAWASGSAWTARAARGSKSSASFKTASISAVANALTVSAGAGKRSKRDTVAEQGAA
jgi:hypothetical protein